MRNVEIHLNVTLGHAFVRYYESDEVRCAWRGNLDLPGDDAQACNILWAYFQNPLGVMVESYQDQAWIERAQALTKSYDDRSLSAGDVITIDGESYAVEMLGFREVEPVVGGELIGPEGDERLREQAEAFNTLHGHKCPACGGDLNVSDNMIACKDQALCGFKQEGRGIRAFVEAFTDAANDLKKGGSA